MAQNALKRTAKQDEIDRNLAFFLKALPTISMAQFGKFALIRHQAIVGYYDTVSDAITSATALYPDGIFSVQQVMMGAFRVGTHVGAAIPS